jgi:NitT/TauT family transport system substrate-binding protein
MSGPHAEGWTRRAFLGELTLAGTAGLLSLSSRPVAAEPPPETTQIRLVHSPSLCISPLYVAEDLLQGEGFTTVHYIKMDGELFTPALISGEGDIALNFVGPLLPHLEAGDPIVILAGGHVGCFELIGTDRVRAIRDLKGKIVAVPEPLGGSPHYVFLASMAAYVGLAPSKDITWVTHPAAESIQLLAEGKIDAFLGFPPYPQEVRAKGIGHVVVNSGVDRPWSQYFCCMMYANRAFVRKHPVATKRALRAVLKAADICALEPDQTARFLMAKGYTNNYNYALQTMTDVVYSKWREFDPEDTMRFYALRLHEAGMIKSTPQKLIAQGTDWRFLNELKKELKG